MTLDTLALWLVRLLGAYAGIGLLFALSFVGRGLARVDAAAAESTWGFRLVVLPGAVAFWPLLLRRVVAARGAAPSERNAHRDAPEAGAPGGQR